MFDLTKQNQEARRLKLPLGELGELQSYGVSPDLHWLLISGKSRGAEWDLLRDQRVFYIRGFRGVSVGQDGEADVDVPKFEETTRHLLHLDPGTHHIDVGTDLDKAEGSQFGSVFLRYKRNGKNEWKWRDVSLDVMDARSGKTLWSRNYPKEAPEVLSRRKEALLVLSWPANSEGAKLEVRSDAALSQRWPKLDADYNDYFLEVVEPRSGKILGATIVRTGKGSFSLSAAEAAGKFIVAADSSNRLHVISLETGEQKGLLFGRRPAILDEPPIVAAENERGQLSLFDLNSLSRVEQYVFTKPITYTGLAGDHRRLLVLTGDQTVYFLKLPVSGAAPTSATAANH
jgi:hypothetical protein